MLGEEGVVGVGDHVDERVADADDVEPGRCGHGADHATGRDRHVHASRAPSRAPRRYHPRGDRHRVRPTLDPYRLPRAAIPTRYDVELAPDLDAATFDGRVEIRVDVAGTDR